MKWLVAISALVAACTGPAGPVVVAETGVAEELPFVPARAAPLPARTADPVAPPARRVDIAAGVVTPSDAVTAEDGRGSVVAAAEAVDVRVIGGAAAAGSATDPVLRIGDAALVRYVLDGDDLRFTIADRSVVAGHDRGVFEHGAIAQDIELAWEER